MNVAMLSVLLLAAPLDRETANDQVQAYLDAADRELEMRKEAMAAKIKDLAAEARIKSNAISLNPAAAKKNRSTQIKLLKEKIKALDTGDVFCAPRLDRRNLVVGQVGRAESQMSPVSPPLRWTGKITQIIDRGNFLFESAGHTYWISGKNTANVADGDAIELSGSYTVEASRTYTTVAGGSKTVQVLNSFSEVDILPYLTEAQCASFQAEPGEEIIAGLRAAGEKAKEGRRKKAKR